MAKTVDNGTLTDYDVATGAGVVDADVQRVTLASDDPAVVALQALDNAIAGSEMQVDVVTMPTVTVQDGGGSLTVDGTVAVTGTFWQATQPVSGTVTANAGSGTFTVAGAVTNTVLSVVGGGTEATAQRVTIASDSTGVLSVDDNGGSLTVDGTVAVSGTVAVTDNAGSLTVDAPVATPVFVRLSDGSSAITTLPVSLASVPSHAVTNAGTFVTQVNGAALTSLQLLDDSIVADDAAFTPGTTKVSMAGFEYDDTTPDSVNEGDAGAARMSANRNQYVQIRDNAGNERGLNVAADGSIAVTVATIPSHAVTNAGTFAVQAAQSGTWNVTNVSGTVSLPTGASTAANQTTLIGHVDGIETLLGTIDADTGALAATVSGTEVQVDVVAALPAGTNAIGKLAANSGVDIGDVDVTSLVPGTSATSLGKAVDSVAGSTDTGVALLAVRDDTLSTLTPADGDYTHLRVTSTGALQTNIVSGSVTATGTINPDPITPGTRVSLIDIDETEDEIKATAGTLYSLVVTNLATSTRFVRMYNATAASTTVGTTTPWRGPYAIPANAGMVYVFERGLTFGTALCIAATTGVADSDTGAPGANEVVAEVVYT